MCRGLQAKPSSRDVQQDQVLVRNVDLDRSASEVDAQAIREGQVLSSCEGHAWRLMLHPAIVRARAQEAIVRDPIRPSGSPHTWRIGATVRLGASAPSSGTLPDGDRLPGRCGSRPAARVGLPAARRWCLLHELLWRQP